MTPSSVCFSFVRACESFRSTAYDDGVGVRTIGYGHVVRPDEAFHTLTREEAEHLLALDMRVAAEDVSRLVRTPLRPHEFDALCSFVFNLGAGSLAKSTLLGKLNANPTPPRSEVAREFRRWHYAKGKPLRGLLRRRIGEEILFLGGHEQSAIDVATGVLST